MGESGVLQVNATDGQWMIILHKFNIHARLSEAYRPVEASIFSLSGIQGI